MTTYLNSVELLALSKHFADLAKSEAAREKRGRGRASGSFILHRQDGWPDAISAKSLQEMADLAASEKKVAGMLDPRTSDMTDAVAAREHLVQLRDTAREARARAEGEIMQYEYLLEHGSADEIAAAVRAHSSRAGKVKVAVNVDIEV